MVVLERKPSQEFVGAVWEPDVPCGANRNAELAVLYLALTAGDVVPEVLAKVEPRDFLYDDCRWVYEEVTKLVASELPPADKAAIADWFKRPEVIQRMKQAKLDWLDDTDQPNPCAFIYALLIDGQWATVANLDYYAKELRKWRVTRGVRTIAWDLAMVINEAPENPLAAIDWLKERLGALDALADSIRPLEVTTTNQGAWTDGQKH